MKNIKLVKKLLIIIMSFLMIFTYSNFVLAADGTGDDADDLFTQVDLEDSDDGATSTSTSDSGASNNSATTNNASNNSATNNTLGGNTNVANENTPSLSTNNQNSANELADTGLSNTGSAILLILVVCGISAIYSYKKIGDYKKL